MSIEEIGRRYWALSHDDRQRLIAFLMCEVPEVFGKAIDEIAARRADQLQQETAEVQS